MNHRVQKPKVALVRGAFLNPYEMQTFEPLTASYDITAFASLKPFSGIYSFPVIHLPSPMDVPHFPYKMPVLNRLFIDAQYLYGLEKKLIGYTMAHAAETYYHYTQQCLEAKKRGYVKKVVATVLENIPFNNAGIWGRKRFMNRSRKELDHIIAISTLSKNALVQEGVDPRRITVIGYGITTKIFFPKTDHWQTLAKQDKQRITILFTGRLVREKGVFDVLEAAHILIRDKGIDKRLIFQFAGNGIEKYALIKTAKQYGLYAHISFSTVPYTMMPDLYEKADIFVAPSITMPTWMEQYGIALLEAQSMGLPIVTTKSGAIPENVGNAALYAGENNPKELAEALKRFIRNPALRYRYGNMARQRALKIHDVHIVSRKIADVYEKILQKH